ncbi:MAG TPA: M23 family metallopeptidase [Candidatus Limnocylindria bacterium]|nr:M23 family metallopeptidase [Candidatus Limnocylindria bacterium]
MRLLTAIFAVLALVAIAALASAPRPGPVTLAVPPTPTPRVWDWPPAAPTEQPTLAHPRLLSGFIVPVDGVAIPTDALHLPNSPRDYRAGYHEGIDFPANAGAPVHAAKAGTVVRVDSAFTEWTAALEQAAFTESLALGYTPTAILDRIRGRQVWIDHGRGIVTRYAHLSAVASLRVGDPVAQGQVIGAVGSSGYPEGGPHLHFEIRVGDDFYGDGLPLPQLRHAISVAFRSP